MIELSITINHVVSLSAETLEVLRRAIPAGDLPEHCCEGFEQRVQDICIATIKQLSKYAHPVENSGQAEQPAPEAPAAPSPTPEPEKTSDTEVTDAMLRKAVKDAKDRSSGAAVRALFAEFEIPNSSACPQERRSELMARLENLK